MAASVKSQDVREKIIKEGVLRYRQSSLKLQRWKPRYVVFKVTHSGRLQLIIYKDQPAIPVNEIKEVPIDEFGGLESNLSLDNEKYAFAIITTHITESFSVESPHEMTEWTTLLQEYLGKELVLNIYIPSKQNILKSGRAQLRVRNTGFTITTCDNPPRCQGTWQIIHIRKYGGSDNFRFQTGTKCPTGEFLYTIQTDDNVRLKSLFNDLSQHRPIFTDDRVGRRMTLERSFNHKIGNHSKVASRFSLQQPSEHDQQHVYQNHNAFTLNNRHNSTDTTVEVSGRRHSAVEGDIFNPHAVQSPTGLAQKSNSGTTNNPYSSDDLSSRQYQNVQRMSHHGRTSPTKKLQHPVMKVLPERYYSVAPPQALKKYRASVNSTPPSSPDDDGFVRGELALDRNSPPVNDHDESEQNDTYIDVANTELSVKAIIGDSLVVHRALPSSPTRNTAGSALPPTITTEVGVYQNLAFMQGNPKAQFMEETDGSPTRFNSASSQANDIETYDAVEGNTHNYTNVEFAREKVSGTPRRLKGTVGEENHWASSPKGSPGKKTRKISAPSGPFNKQNKTKVSSTESVLTSSLELPSPSLRNSHSDYELNKAGIPTSPVSGKGNDEKQAVFDYYNILVPHLPAHSKTKGLDFGLRNKFDSTNHSRQTDASSDVVVDTTSGYLPSPKKGDRGIQPEDLALSENIVGQSAVEEFPKEVSDAEEAAMLSNKHIPSSTVPLPSMSKTPGTSAQYPSNPGIYDTLAPLVDGSDTPGASSSHPLYDSLLPKSKSRSTSSSPELCNYSPDHLNRTYQYNRKVQLLQHGHKYEYIDVELPQNETNSSRSNHGKQECSSPIRKEHPSSWMTTPSPRHDERSGSVLRSLPSISSRRKKQLPLQDSSDEVESPSVVTDRTYGASESGSAVRKSMPQLSQMPKDSSIDHSCESPKSPRKPQPLPRKGVQPQQVSNELISSIESYIGKQENSLPLGHSDIVDGKPYPTKCDGNQVTAFSYPQRLTTEIAAPKIKSIQVELAKEPQDGSEVDPPVLPPRQPLSSNGHSEDTRLSSQSPLPAIPPRPSATKKDSIDPTKAILPPTTSTQRLSEPGIKLPLPQKEIKFHPPGPPKPRVLCPPPDNTSQQKYVAVSFADVPASDSSEYHEVVVHPVPPSVQQGHNNDFSENRVEYIRVDFNMTYGLGKTIEQVEDRRRGFPDS